MDRRQLAKTGFLGLCGALMGKKVEKLTKPRFFISYSGEGIKRVRTVIRFPDHPANSTEPVPPGWDFLNDPEEDVYNGTR